MFDRAAIVRPLGRCRIIAGEVNRDGKRAACRTVVPNRWKWKQFVLDEGIRYTYFKTVGKASKCYFFISQIPLFSLKLVPIFPEAFKLSSWNYRFSRK